MTKRPLLHVVVYGHPNTFKSTFAATFPKPIYVCQFDGYGKDAPYIRAGATTEDDESDAGVPIKRVLDKKDNPIIEIRYYTDPEPEKPDAWELFRREQRAFDPSKWGTWVLDSITSAVIAAKYQQQFKINPDALQPMQWVAGATDQLEMQIARRAAGFPCNVVVCCHIAEKFVMQPGSRGQPERRIDKRVELEETPEGETVVLRGLSAPGRLARASGLISQFSETYRSYVTRNGKGEKVYLLQTDSDADYVAASQIPAPNPCAPEYDALFADVEKERR